MDSWGQARSAFRKYLSQYQSSKFEEVLLHEIHKWIPGVRSDLPSTKIHLNVEAQNSKGVAL